MKLNINFKFGKQIDRNEYYHLHIKIPQCEGVFRLMWQFKILEIRANISETLEDGVSIDRIAMED